jgi:hypothetical protein
MGNKAKRVKLAKRLKQLGMGKLYSGNKRVAWRLLCAYQLNSMLRKLQYAPGDICHDCDGFNHVVVKWVEGIRSFKHWSYTGKTNIKGWAIDIDQFEKSNGGWSCGCNTSPDPPTSREDIEKYMTAYLNDPKLKEQGWTVSALDDRRRDALNRGEHICDERGILLDEYNLWMNIKRVTNES